jgi:hypothetical protein
MRRIRVGIALTSVLAGLWLGCGGPRLQLFDPARPIGPRPGHFGVSLPVPMSSALRMPAIAARTGRAERRIPVYLNVDTKGKVGRAAFESSADSAAVAAYVPYLKSFRFEPGLREGTRSDFRLRIEIQTGGTGTEPALIFPVGPNREIVRAETYWAALKAVGIEPARLVQFPSYYYIPTSASTGNRYDFKTYRIELDSLGRVTEVAPLSVSSPRFTDQIATAAMWAAYEPMRIGGTAVPSTNYLSVALFSEASYPTTKWLADSLGGIPDKERLRVRLLPDTLGEMFPAIVKRDWSGPIIDSAVWEPNPELISARIVVDTAGLATPRESSHDSWRVRRMLMGRAFDRGFYPARNFAGSPLTWPGLAYVRYLDSSHVGIWFDWAPSLDPKPAPPDASTAK